MARTAEKDEPKTAAELQDDFEVVKIRVRVETREIGDGVDFAFNYQLKPIADKNGKVIKTYPVERYHLVNGKEYDMPLEVVEHLEQLERPEHKYDPKGEEGQQIKVVGTYRRFMISRLG